MDPRTLVAYFVAPRWDSSDQRELSLSAQQNAARRFEIDNSFTCIQRYTESSPSRRSRHEVLAAAISHAKRTAAVLLVVEFKRVARDPTALALLVDSGVEFAACDFPQANRASVSLLAAIVAEESRYLSQMTKTALAHRRRCLERGESASDKAAVERPRSTPSNQRAAWNQASSLGPRLLQLRSEGKTLRQIAAIVATEGYITRSGRPWTHTHVRRILTRYETRLGPLQD